MASKDQKELNKITKHVLSDKMQELRVRMSNGNIRSYLGTAIVTKGEVQGGILIEDYEVYPAEENDEGNMIQGITVHLPDGRTGNFVGLPLATEEELEQNVHIASFKIGYPEDMVDNIRDQVAEEE